VAQHGYLREYDEGPDRSDDRERDWSDRNRERSWRGGERDWDDRDRGFMFDRDRDRSSDDDRGGGFMGRMGDRARSWFSDDDRQYRSPADENRGAGHRSHEGARRDQGFSGSRSDYPSGRPGYGQGSRRNFRSHQDDHYLSWRDRQIDALDRDYADYCREREQQFHSDFDNWRQSRQQRSQSRQDSDATAQAGELELTHERALAEQGNTPTPVGDATLGTNNSENSASGRR
jgi:hypothetical protein